MGGSGYRRTGIGLFGQLGLVGVLAFGLLLHRRCGRLGGLLLRLGSLRRRLTRGTGDLTIRRGADRSLWRRSVLWTSWRLLLVRLRGLLLLHRLLWGLMRLLVRGLQRVRLLLWRLLLWTSQSRTWHSHRRLTTHRRRVSSKHASSLVRTRAGSVAAMLLLRRGKLVIRRHSHRRRGLLLLELPRRRLWWRIRTRALLLHAHSSASPSPPNHLPANTYTQDSWIIQLRRWDRWLLLRRLLNPQVLNVASTEYNVFVDIFRARNFPIAPASALRAMRHHLLERYRAGLGIDLVEGTDISTSC